MSELCNEYDEIAKIFDTASLTRDYLFSQDLKNLLIGITDDDMRQQIILACQDKATEFRKATVWNEWFKQFAKQITRAKTRTVSNMADKQVQGYEFGDYAIDDRGIHYYDSNAECYRDFCKGTPLVVSRIFENIEHEPEKIELTFKLRGRWRSIYCDRITASDARKALMLAEYGISINSINGALFVAYITDFIAMNTKIIELVSSVGRPGWYGTEFVPYDTRYTYDGEHSNKERYDALRECGAVELWAKECNRVRLNPIVRMSIDASLASPLLHLINGQMFLVHLWGTTEAGKSVALLLALSAWGDADKLMQTHNATLVGLERLAWFYNHLPMALDELQAIKDKYSNTDKSIYQVCSGSGRVRGNKSGGNDKPAFWKNIILSTGEQPFTEDNSGGGAKNRAIELHCDCKLFDNVQQTLEVLRCNHGVVGVSFLNDFVKPMHKDGMLLKAYKYICAEFSKLKFTDKQRNSIAAMCLADSGYNTLFLGLEFAEALANSLNFYKNSEHMFTDKEDIKIGARSYDDFMSWVAMNSNKFDEASNAEIYGVKEQGCVCILSTALDKWCNESGFAKRAALAEWKNNGHLIGSATNKFRSKCTIMQDSVNCYKVKIENNEQLKAETDYEILKMFL